jgi:hypothetical protein
VSIFYVIDIFLRRNTGKRSYCTQIGYFAAIVFCTQAAVVADLSGQKVVFNRVLGLIYYTCLLVFSSQLVDSADLVHAEQNNSIETR